MSTTFETIYVDEAGNTGQDLLNKDQRAFVLASNNYSTEQIQTLVSLFPKSDELHFAKLKDSTEGRAALIKFLNHPLISEEHIECFTAHKEYATVGHIVDRLIEPVYYDQNIDIYQHGLNITLTNYIYHFGIGGIWDKSIFEPLLTSFIQMARKKGRDEIEHFYDLAESLFNSALTNEKALLLPVLESKNQIDDILPHIDKFSLDITLSAFYVLCDRWHKKTDKKLIIYQDNSKQIDHYREYIDFTTQLNMEKTTIGYDSRAMTYPTQIERLQMVSSANTSGVQLADLIASAVAFMYNNNKPKQNAFVREIQKSRLLDLSNFYTVWPNSDVTPEELGMAEGKGQNPLDFLAYHSYKSNQGKF